MRTFGRNITFNGHDLAEFGVIESVERPPMGALSITSATVPGRRGIVFGAQRLGSLEIRARLRLICEDKAQMRRRLSDLAAIMDVRLYAKPQKLEISDEPGRYRLAVPSRVTVSEEMEGTCLVEITFTCPDPIAYGSTEHSFVIDDDFHEIGGNCATYPTIKITGLKTTNSAVQYADLHDSIGGILMIPVTSTGRTVEIDCEARTLKINAVAALPSVWSDWFEWGASRKVKLYTSFPGVTWTRAVVTWHERWY